MLLFGLIWFPKFTVPVQVQFISLPILISVSVCLQDYLMTHMYGNAARDDLWNKFSEVRFYASSRCETSIHEQESALGSVSVECQVKLYVFNLL